MLLSTKKEIQPSDDRRRRNSSNETSVQVSIEVTIPALRPICLLGIISTSITMWDLTDTNLPRSHVLKMEEQHATTVNGSKVSTRRSKKPAYIISVRKEPFHLNSIIVAKVIFSSGIGGKPTDIIDMKAMTLPASCKLSTRISRVR